MRSHAKASLRVAVAGGSIGGLCTGIALRAIGCDVNIFERTTGPMTSRGAGIVVQPDLLSLLQAYGAPRLPMTTCTHRQYSEPNGASRLMPAPQQFTSWEAIYMTLRAVFPADRYIQGMRLTSFDQSDDNVTLAFDGHAGASADLLVCAEGARSASRDHLITPPLVPSYAGYFAWRGTPEEADASGDLVRFFADRFSFCDARSGGHVLVYFIPGENASSQAGHRRINWVWYVHAPEGPELDRFLTDKDGQRRPGSVPPGAVNSDVVDELYQRAAAELHPQFAELIRATREPFIQVIQDLAVPRMVFGRVALLGDAAFVVRPHTAAGTAKAAADATVLAAMLQSYDSVDEALRAWGRARVAAGMSLAEYGVALGDRTARAR